MFQRINEHRYGVFSRWSNSAQCTGGEAIHNTILVLQCLNQCRHRVPSSVPNFTQVIGGSITHTGVFILQFHNQSGHLLLGRFLARLRLWLLIGGLLRDGTA